MSTPLPKNPSTAGKNNTSNAILLETLIEFGLSDKEAKTYIALLELEVATVNEIAKTTGVNRSSTYVVLESMKKQGIVATSDDKKVQQYMAAPPEVLLRIAEEESKKHETIKNNINTVVPELKALYKGTKRKPRVMVYEGKQGLISAFEDTLETKEGVIRVASSVGNIFKAVPGYLPKYVQLRRNKGIRMFGIHPNDNAAKMIDKKPISTIDTLLFIEPKKYPFPADLAIYDNKVAYMWTSEKIVLVIESKEIADMMKNVFDLAFKEAERLAVNQK